MQPFVYKYIACQGKIFCSIAISNYKSVSFVGCVFTHPNEFYKKKETLAIDLQNFKSRMVKACVDLAK